MGVKEMEEHMNNFFTEWGFKTLHEYTKSLVMEYIKRKDEDYPFTIGVIMGIPFFNSTTAEREFKNKDELAGRIKGFMQLLCIKKVEVNNGKYDMIFELGDNNGK